MNQFKKRITAIIIAVVAILAIPTAVVAVINAMPDPLEITTISDVKVSVEAPELGAVPGIVTASGDDYTIESYKWVNNKDNKEVEGTFEVNKAYALEVVLKAKKHAKFENALPYVDNAVLISGDIDANAGGTMTVRALFPSVTTPVPDAPYFLKVKDNGSFSVVAPYSESENVVINFARKGPNNLLEISSFGTVSIAYKNAEALNAPEYHQKMNSYTDMFGPYIVDATADPAASGPFTGGNHGYMNSGSTSDPANTPTGRCVYVDVYADGQKINGAFEGLVDEIEVKWENRVQGRNTCKADGSGREILKEEYTMVMDGEKLNIHNNITALEEITIGNYYGLQMTPWFGTVEYINGSTPGPYNIGTSSAGSTKCNEALFEKDGMYVKMFMLPMIGMGDFRYANPNRNGSVFNDAGSSSKAYCNMIGGSGAVTLAANESIEFSGGYQFYFVEK